MRARARKPKKAPVLSASCIRALEDATAAACAEVLQSTSPGQLWKHVIGVVYPVLQKHARQHTEARSPAVALPPEVLVEIFARMPFPDRIRAALVCHRWRSVSLAAPAALWSSFPSILDMASYRSLLVRSCGLPVTLRHQQVDPDAVPLFYGILKDYLHRVKALHLVLAEPCMADAAQWELAEPSRHLSEAFLCPAPLLETICISDYYGEFSNTYRDLPILRNPKLRTIELHGFYIKSLKGCAGLRTLRRLKISTHQEYHALPQEDCSVLLSFPALEVLAVQLACVTRLQSRRAPFPATLKSLHLELSWDAFQTLVSVQDVARIHTLRLSFNDSPSPSLDDLRPFFPDPMVAAAVHLQSSELSLKAVDERGRQRILQQLAPDTAWCRCLPSIARLTLSKEGDTPSELADALAAFPRLQDLTLDATLADYDDEDGINLHQWPHMECPELHTVRFVAPEGGSAVPLDMITPYLDKLLGARTPSARRISQLIFDRVRLAPVPGVDVTAALRAFADTVYTGPSDSAWAEDDWRVWNQDWDALSDCY